MATPTNAQLGKLLASYLSTSTLQNELLAKIANKKLIFVVSLQRKSKKNKKKCKFWRTFFSILCIIGVRELAIYKTKFYTATNKVLHQGLENSLFLV
jgi:hypothetical protein